MKLELIIMMKFYQQEKNHAQLIRSYLLAQILIILLSIPVYKNFDNTYLLKNF